MSRPPLSTPPENRIPRRPLRKAITFYDIKRGPLMIGWNVYSSIGVPVSEENWITRNWFLTNKQARKFAGWE